jgi:hypothetical protein
MSALPFPLWAWLVFVGIVLALLFLDLFVLHRNAREVPFKRYGFRDSGSLSPLPSGGWFGFWLAWAGPKRTSPPTCWRRASRWITSSCSA